MMEKEVHQHLFVGDKKQYKERGHNRGDGRGVSTATQILRAPTKLVPPWTTLSDYIRYVLFRNAQERQKMSHPQSVPAVTTRAASAPFPLMDTFSTQSFASLVEGMRTCCFIVLVASRIVSSPMEALSSISVCFPQG